MAAQTAPGTLPTGGQVTSGSATLTYTPNKLQIDQSTNKAILQWDGFSIGSNAWVNFSQPSASSVALNRVTGTNPSEIFGRLTANGQVFLSNPSGVLFAPGASVDVGGLFATTLSIADRDFLAGRYNFYNAGGAGSVVNQGVITATGYAALAGPQVKNDGIIIARAGTVALAAGERVSLDMVGDGLIKVSVDEAALNASAINSGRIEADGGNVILTARSANALLDTVVNNSGVIRANSLVERNGEIVLDGGGAGVVANSGALQAAGLAAGTTGGVIRIFGDRVAVTAGGVVDASGDAGGGSVTVGSPSSSGTFIAAGATIRADATGEGSGGIVETSGRYLEVNSAPQVGAGGTWLIDPYNIEIVDGSATANNTGPAAFTPNGDNSQIGAALINNQLNAGANVVVDTGGAGSPGTQAGDLIVNGQIAKTSVNGSTLTLSAFHDLQINRNISMANGQLAFNAGSVTNNATVTNNTAISTGLGSNTIFSSDAFNLAGGAVNGGTGAVILRPRTTTNSFGIESAGATTVTNADIASISTSDFVVFGSGTASIFSGNMTIGANAQVNGGGKNLAFFRGSNVPGSTTVGPSGVASTGNLIVSAGGGALNSNGGMVAGNQVQLRAGTGIGSATSRVNTAANVLSINNAGGAGAFVNAIGPVTINNVNLTVGGIVNNISNNVSGAYDLTAADAVTVTGQVFGGTMNVTAAGPLRVLSTGAAAASLQSNAGQTITAGSLEVTADGINAAIINISGNQSISVAGDITLQNSTTNFTNSFAGIVGPSQTISAGGNVNLQANFATGTSHGVRIGGLAGTAPTSTGLNLTAGGNVTLSGGTGANNGAALGSSIVTSLPNTITVNAGGNVALNSGVDGGARIGYAQGLPAAGDISITAANIQLNGTAQPTSIRTTGNVTLNATGSVAEASNGFIVANGLTVTAPGTVLLGGANQIATFNGASGDLTLNNSGALNVTGSSAANATLTNNGATTIGGFWKSLGSTSITTTGAAADLNVTNNVSATGNMNVNVSGALNVSGSGAASASLSSSGTQTINASSLGVTSRDGRIASINQTGAGNQSITVTGGAIDIQVLNGNGGSANVTAAGSQTVSLVNGDHISVNGAAGIATLLASNGTQTISATGLGRNAITVGSTGALGPSNVGALSQSVTAGLGSEAGSITIVGTAATSALAGFVTNTVAGGTQTISTSGQVSVTGGSALSQLSSFGTGIFHNGTGAQTINAAGIAISGGTAGNGNSAFISSLGGVAGNAGNQFINVAGGDITVTAGSVGSANRAGITSNANQTIARNPNIFVTGGANGGGSGTTNTSNAAFISANNPGRLQTINAANITVKAGTGGIDTSATITAANQVISASGDVTINGGGGTGTANGARIGGPSGAATSLVLNARNVAVNAGATSGAGIGSSVLGTPQPNTITVNASGDVALNDSSGAGARIGSSSSNGTAGGDITLNAGGNIALNGVAAGTAIRTLGNVTLNAGGAITEASNGFINANTLSVKAGSASLTGANAIGAISAPLQPGNLPGVTGNFSLNNTGALTITDLRAGGTVSLTNAGTITLKASGTQDARITSVGGQSITADGLILTAQDGRVANINNVSGNQSIVTGTGGIQLSVAASGQGVAQIANNRGAVTSGTQTVQTSGALNVVGGSTTTGSTNSGIFQMQTGKQTVTAGSVSLAAANAAVSNGGAFISNTGNNNVADQEINVTGGSITLTGGGVALANRAGISTNGNQTINGNPDILITGGGSGAGTGGNANSAFISANGTGKTQTINAGNITLKAGPGGTDTSATITGTKQVITATGDVRITGSDGNAGDSNGARIGGSGGNTPSATDLTLTARDVILTAGAAASGAALGSSNNATTPPDNNITVNARDVILNASDTNGVRIGTNSDFATPAAGTISVTASRDIALNGMAAHAAAIRTTGNVSLQADRNLSSTTSGFVLANALAVKSTTGSTSLIGPNQVSFLTGTSAGALSFVNTAPLTVNGTLSSGGAMDLNVGGMLSVVGNAAAPASISSIGGQTITATSLDVRSNGANATITNTGGDQSITVNGGSIDVHTVAPIGFAQILENGAGMQTVTATGADHLDVTAEFGNASIQAINGASQVVSVTGTGAPGSGGIHLANSSSNFLNSFAGINAAQQNITASGDITLTANFATGTSHGVRVGGIGGVPGTDTNLTMSTGGNVVLNGGAGAANGAAIGSTVASAHPSTITINALDGNVILNSGADAGARIGYASGLPAGGNITINAVGLQLNGTTQPVAIRTQDTVNLNLSGAATENPNSFIQAGALNVNAASASLIGPNQVGAFNSTTTGNVSLVNIGALNVTGVSAGGNATLDNTGNATVSGPWTAGGTTSITVHSDLLLSDRVTSQDVVLSSTSGSIREEGGGAISARTLTTSSVGDTTLAAANQIGTFNGAAGGDVTLVNTDAMTVTGLSAARNATLENAGDVTVAGLWSASGTASINAAGGAILEVGAGAIHATSLTTTSAGDTLLRGANSVGTFSASSQSGSVALVNSGALTLGGIAAPGGFDLANTGAVSFTGPISTNGTLALASDVDLNLTQALQAGELRLTSSAGSITSAGAVALTADTLRTNAAHDTVLLGANAVQALDAQTGGALRFNDTGALTLLGVHAADAGITAGGAITEAAGGAIVAPVLTSSSGGAILLGGANQVGRFAASAGGDVLLTNASPVLSLGTMSLPGALTISQTGALSLVTSINSLSQSYSATGDIQVGDASASTSSVLAASGAMAMSSGGSILLRGSDTSPGVSAIVSGGTVNMSNAGDLHLLGGAAAGSQALIRGGTAIDLTVGGVLALDGNSDNGSWARVQTATTSGTINVYFPTTSSGGYLVDGFARLKHGEDGFFTGDKPAKAGTSLFLHYGP